MLNRWDVAILNYEKATIAYKEIAAEEQVRKVRHNGIVFWSCYVMTTDDS